MSGIHLEWNPVEQQLESLRALVEELRRDVGELRAENVELRREVGYRMTSNLCLKTSKAQPSVTLQAWHFALDTPKTDDTLWSFSNGLTMKKSLFCL